MNSNSLPDHGHEHAHPTASISDTQAGGLVNAAVFWWDLDLGHGCKLSNSPLRKFGAQVGWLACCYGVRINRIDIDRARARPHHPHPLRLCSISSRASAPRARPRCCLCRTTPRASGSSGQVRLSSIASPRPSPRRSSASGTRRCPHGICQWWLTRPATRRLRRQSSAPWQPSRSGAAGRAASGTSAAAAGCSP